LYKDGQQCQKQHSYEQKEAQMVFDPHAIIDPGAVMIESLNAITTDFAMTTSISPYDLAVRTKHVAVNSCEKGYKISSLWPDATGLQTRTQYKENQRR